MKPNEGSTVIGKSVVVRGELSGNEDLFMDGDLEGSITLTESRLTIGPNARMLADLNVRDLVVFGHLTGNVRASGRIELRQSAVVSGDIFASRLSIEESAVMKGRIELVAAALANAASGSGPVAAEKSAGAAFALEPKA
jgi:cytoskeletal protein CcmA (bactofilin family)